MSESGPQSQIEHLAQQYIAGPQPEGQKPEEKPVARRSYKWLITLVLLVAFVVVMKYGVSGIWDRLIQNWSDLLGEF